MGGLSKKSSLLKKLAPSANSLKVDAGTLFFDDKIANQPERLAQAAITASAIVESYNHMGYDAIAIGRQDLSAGLDILKALAKQASFPFLSANLFDTKGSLIFEPVKHVELSGLRISIIGLTGHTNVPDNCLQSVKILPWQEVLPPMMATISSTSDLVIILSNLSATENREIAMEMADVHLLLQSGISKQNMRPQLINNTLITQAGHDGKYQGQITVNWTPAKKWQQGEKPLLALRKEYDRLGWLINRVRKKGGPQVVYQNNEAGLRTFQEKQQRYHELELEIKKIASSEKQSGVGSAQYINHFHPLPPSVADDPTITKILQESRKKANQLRRQRVDTKILDPYIGSSSCRSCHEVIYQAWQQTPHASAYQTLLERDQDNNLNCVYCHVTGLDEDSAYLAAAMPETLKSVGCEVCHGPGKNHAAQPHLSPPPQTPQATLCTNCHNRERDDDFDFQTDNNKVH